MTENVKKSSNRTVLVVTAVICATLLIASGIGAAVYINQQKLTQQKSLKEAEIKAENDRAEKQRQLDSENSKRDCRSKAEYSFKCL